MDLVADLSLSDLPELRQRLLEALASGLSPLRLETAALTRASLPLVQVLFAAQLAAQRRGQRLEIACPPDGALARALVDLGLTGASDFRPQIDSDVWTGFIAA